MSVLGGGVTRNLKPYDKDNGQLGMVAAPPWAGLTTINPAAGNAYVVRFVPSRPMTIIKVAFVVSTAAGADDACDVGIYDSTLTNKLVSAGATLGKLNALGAQAVTVAATNLSPGTVYYAAWSVLTPFGGTAVTLDAVSWGANSGAEIFGTAVGTVSAGPKATSHPLPADLSALTATVTSASPLLAVRES